METPEEAPREIDPTPSEASEEQQATFLEQNENNAFTIPVENIDEDEMQTTSSTSTFTISQRVFLDAIPEDEEILEEIEELEDSDQILPGSDDEDSKEDIGGPNGL